MCSVSREKEIWACIVSFAKDACETLQKWEAKCLACVLGGETWSFLVNRGYLIMLNPWGEF